MELGFSEEVLAILYQASGNGLYPLQNYEEATIGLSFSRPEGEAEQIVEELRSKILPRGYCPFISDVEFERGNNSRIGVVKTDNQFQLLKILDTNGENYDVSNEDVIGKLTEWHKRFPFTVIGANFDWVDLAFIKMPTGIELAELAQEIMELCPDAVEDADSAEDIQDLIIDLKDTKRLLLWWD